MQCHAVCVFVFGPELMAMQCMYINIFIFLLMFIDIYT